MAGIVAPVVRWRRATKAEIQDWSQAPIRRLRRRERKIPNVPSRPNALADNTRELGSGMVTPGTFMPAVVPNENVADVIVVSAEIPAPVIVNVADSSRKGL